MKVVILGGDGYLGWPTAMHLSKNGHEIAVVDNYMRRNIMFNENVEPLFSVPNLDRRVEIWNNKTSSNIKVFIGDLNEWSFVSEVFNKFKPDVVVHYAEQPSAPYSMLNRRSSTLTLKNNLLVTANIIFAVREFCPEAHIVKLGTMGEYGTPNIDIEEGWINVNHKGREDKFLFPRQAGSLYHTTKIMDTDLLWFYTRVWNLKVTDLMQGPVYGIFTDEMDSDEELMTHYSYDELFGTVLNRFIVQAIAGHPLTIYGKGGQTRGYLNIVDTLNCVRLAIENAPEVGEMKIFNQFTETFSVNDLAQIVKKAAQNIGVSVKIQNITNPRKEMEEHYYNPIHKGFIEMGLKPTVLSEEVLQRIMKYVLKHKHNIANHKIFRGNKWDRLN